MAKQFISTEALERMLSRNLGWVSSADSKVAPILAMSTAMLGTLAAFFATKTNLGGIQLVLLAVSTLLLLASIVFLGTAVFPRTRGPADSVVFFGAIAGLPKDRYIRKLASLTEEEFHRDLAVQCHRNAQIAAAKYKAVRRAMACLLAGILPWLLTLWQLWSYKKP